MLNDGESIVDEEAAEDQPVAVGSVSWLCLLEARAMGRETTPIGLAAHALGLIRARKYPQWPGQLWDLRRAAEALIPSSRPVQL